MLDIETYRRGIGLFQQGSINCKSTEDVFTNSSVTTLKKCSSNIIITWKNAIKWKVLLVILVITSMILWTLQDTRSSKNHQRGKSFSNFAFEKNRKKKFIQSKKKFESLFGKECISEKFRY